MGKALSLAQRQALAALIDCDCLEDGNNPTDCLGRTFSPITLRGLKQLGLVVYDSPGSSWGKWHLTLKGRDVASEIHEREGWLPGARGRFYIVRIARGRKLVRYEALDVDTQEIIATGRRPIAMMERLVRSGWAYTNENKRNADT